MVELLAPAGSYESLCAAVNAGADAVYIGGNMFGARAYADNPDEEHLKQGIDYCHLHGRRIYMTVNTLLKEKELQEDLHAFLQPYYERGVDGLIVQDLGVVRYVHEHFPGLEVHASTQMTVTSAHGAGLLGQMGLTRVVPARELSLAEVRTIIEETGLEVETFVHGAMCYSYSGQCLFSSMLGGRSGNRGRCAQPCRLPYQLEEGRKGDTRYLLSMKDMCTLEQLPELIDAGIASLKIEGRMKRPEYTAGVVQIYRKYIDRYLAKRARGYHVEQEDLRLLMDLYNRGGFSEGYYKQHNGRRMMALDRPNHQGTQAARIERIAKGAVRAVALEPLCKKDVLEVAPGVEKTLTEDIRRGQAFSLTVGRAPVAVGDIVSRTKCEYLLQQLQEQYLKKNIQEKIKGELKIFQGAPAILKLWCRQAHVTAKAEIAELAESNPTPQETIVRQMHKTGNTPFVFESLQIQMDDGLFVSIGALNALRRSALEQLEQEILRAAAVRAGRSVPDRTENQDSRPSEHRTAPGLNILVSTMAQLDAVMAHLVPQLDTIYLDSMLFAGDQQEIGSRITQLQAHGLRCFLNAAPVLRTRELAFYQREWMQDLLGQLDGVLVHTMDELAWFRDFFEKHHPSAVVAGDDSLYAYNSVASAYLTELGVRRQTLPAELNSRELAAFDRPGSELNLYGYQPLMHSAQCVVRNTKGCTGKPEILHLKDRKGICFPVWNRCPFCCNTIYNSVPLQLGGCRSEVAALAPDYLRLSFTVEDREETERILLAYVQIFFGDGVCTTDLTGTKGHFKRGVE